jgi:outer membrane murein-binding lipoprotein Lpp
MTALKYVAMALAVLEELLRMGGNATALVVQLRTTVRALQAEKRDPTEDEWQALNAQIAAAMEALG